MFTVKPAMFSIRPAQPVDDESIKRITAESTVELRAVYAPKALDKTSVTAPSSAPRVVALDIGHAIVGVAEYIVESTAVYVQGIAVSASHRRCGIAAALLKHIEMITAGLQIPALKVKTILETGNVEIFERMGFHLIDERVSERFIGPQGQAVFEVTLERAVASL
jgi:GNAT superfamily N-acetyltransferase